MRSDTEPFYLHSHDYYELFVVLCGDVVHIINGKEQHLTKGQLLFIRDFDVHNYKSADDEYFEFINLAFTKAVFCELVRYLGKGFPAEDLLKNTFPPLVSLSNDDREKLFYALTSLESGGDKEKTKIRLKFILIQIFMKYFYEYSPNKNNVPVWLEMTYEKMKEPENFVQGIERMYEICPKSREHLCRTFKKYYGITPGEYITDLRLEYSVNLLITSNLTVTDICFECGFENISWFYKAFENKYKTTPLKYRKSI